MRASSGDARRLLNTFELCIKAAGPGEVTITDDLVKEVVQGPAARYDKQGATLRHRLRLYQKSLRGSDPHAPCTGWPAWWRAARIPCSSPGAW